MNIVLRPYEDHFKYGYVETDDDNDDEIDVNHLKDKGSFTSHTT